MRARQLAFLEGGPLFAFSIFFSIPVTFIYSFIKIGHKTNEDKVTRREQCIYVTSYNLAAFKVYAGIITLSL